MDELLKNRNKFEEDNKLKDAIVGTASLFFTGAGLVSLLGRKSTIPELVKAHMKDASDKLSVAMSKRSYMRISQDTASYLHSNMRAILGNNINTKRSKLGANSSKYEYAIDVSDITNSKKEIDLSFQNFHDNMEDLTLNKRSRIKVNTKFNKWLNSALEEVEDLNKVLMDKNRRLEVKLKGNEKVSFIMSQFQGDEVKSSVNLFDIDIAYGPEGNLFNRKGKKWLNMYNLIDINKDSAFTGKKVSAEIKKFSDFITERTRNIFWNLGDPNIDTSSIVNKKIKNMLFEMSHTMPEAYLSYNSTAYQESLLGSTLQFSRYREINTKKAMKRNLHFRIDNIQNQIAKLTREGKTDALTVDKLRQELSDLYYQKAHSTLYPGDMLDIMQKSLRDLYDKGLLFEYSPVNRDAKKLQFGKWTRFDFPGRALSHKSRTSFLPVFKSIKELTDPELIKEYNTNLLTSNKTPLPEFAREQLLARNELVSYSKHLKEKMKSFSPEELRYTFKAVVSKEMPVFQDGTVFMVMQDSTQKMLENKARIERTVSIPFTVDPESLNNAFSEDMISKAKKGRDVYDKTRIRITELQNRLAELNEELKRAGKIHRQLPRYSLDKKGNKKPRSKFSEFTREATDNMGAINVSLTKNEINKLGKELKEEIRKIQKYTQSSKIKYSINTGNKLDRIFAHYQKHGDLKDLSDELKTITGSDILSRKGDTTVRFKNEIRGFDKGYVRKVWWDNGELKLDIIEEKSIGDLSKAEGKQIIDTMGKKSAVNTLNVLGIDSELSQNLIDKAGVQFIDRFKAGRTEQVTMAFTKVVNDVVVERIGIDKFVKADGSLNQDLLDNTVRKLLKPFFPGKPPKVRAGFDKSNKRVYFTIQGSTMGINNMNRVDIINNDPNYIERPEFHAELRDNINQIESKLGVKDTKDYQAIVTGKGKKGFEGYLIPETDASGYKYFGWITKGFQNVESDAAFKIPGYKKILFGGVPGGAPLHYFHRKALSDMGFDYILEIADRMTTIARSHYDPYLKFYEGVNQMLETKTAGGLSKSASIEFDQITRILENRETVYSSSGFDMESRFANIKKSLFKEGMSEDKIDEYLQRVSAEGFEKSVMTGNTLKEYIKLVEAEEGSKFLDFTDLEYTDTSGKKVKLFEGKGIKFDLYGERYRVKSMPMYKPHRASGDIINLGEEIIVSKSGVKSFDNVYHISRSSVKKQFQLLQTLYDIRSGNLKFSSKNEAELAISRAYKSMFFATLEDTTGKHSLTKRLDKPRVHAMELQIKGTDFTFNQGKIGKLNEELYARLHAPVPVGKVGVTKQTLINHLINTLDNNNLETLMNDIRTPGKAFIDVLQKEWDELKGKIHVDSQSSINANVTKENFKDILEVLTPKNRRKILKKAAIADIKDLVNNIQKGKLPGGFAADIREPVYTDIAGVRLAGIHIMDINNMNFDTDTGSASVKEMREEFKRLVKKNKLSGVPKEKIMKLAEKEFREKYSIGYQTFRNMIDKAHKAAYMNPLDMLMQRADTDGDRTKIVHDMFDMLGFKKAASLTDIEDRMFSMLDRYISDPKRSTYQIIDRIKDSEWKQRIDLKTGKKYYGGEGYAYIEGSIDEALDAHLVRNNIKISDDEIIKLKDRLKQRFKKAYGKNADDFKFGYDYLALPGLLDESEIDQAFKRTEAVLSFSDKLEKAGFSKDEISKALDKAKKDNWFYESHIRALHGMQTNEQITAKMFTGPLHNTSQKLQVIWDNMKVKPESWSRSNNKLLKDFLGEYFVQLPISGKHGVAFDYETLAGMYRSIYEGAGNSDYNMYKTFMLRGNLPMRDLDNKITETTLKSLGLNTSSEKLRKSIMMSENFTKISEIRAEAFKYAAGLDYNKNIIDPKTGIAKLDINLFEKDTLTKRSINVNAKTMVDDLLDTYKLSVEDLHITSKSGKKVLSPFVERFINDYEMVNINGKIGRKASKQMHRALEHYKKHSSSLVDLLEATGKAGNELGFSRLSDIPHGLSITGINPKIPLNTKDLDTLVKIQTGEISDEIMDRINILAKNKNVAKEMVDNPITGKQILEKTVSKVSPGKGTALGIGLGIIGGLHILGLIGSGDEPVKQKYGLGGEYFESINKKISERTYKSDLLRMSSSALGLFQKIARIELNDPTSNARMRERDIEKAIYHRNQGRSFIPGYNQFTRMQGW